MLLNKKLGRPSNKLKVTCLQCSKSGDVYPCLLHKKYFKYFCSKECRLIYKKINKSKKKCSIPDCLREHDKANYCSHHYHKWRKYGNPLIITRRGGPKKTKIKKLCLNCTKEFETWPSRSERKKFCSKKCLYEGVGRLPRKTRSFDSKHWYEPKKNGYLGKIHNRKMVWQHRYVAEQMLNRKLLDSEVVHHINGVKGDNRPENLIVYNRAEHSKKHKEIFYEYLRLKKENEELKKQLDNIIPPSIMLNN